MQVCKTFNGGSNPPMTSSGFSFERGGVSTLPYFIYFIGPLLVYIGTTVLFIREKLQVSGNTFTDKFQ